MASPRDPLFTSRFFVMCGFTFSVFLSAFQLFPTAPFHIRDLGGSTFAAGLFLGFLTYSSALTAPFTGALGDRIGQRRALVVCSTAIAAFSAVYAVVPGYRLLLALVVVHGVFWSGLLTNSSAYLTGELPPSRRAEGIGYWGLSTVAAVAVAPALGFALYQRGWAWICASSLLLNLVMLAIAWSLPDDRSLPAHHAGETADAGGALEWRVLAMSLTLFLYSFGYGGITSFSAMFADALAISPKGIFLTVMMAAMFCLRPLAGPLADRYGYTRVLLPCLALITAGLALLAGAASRRSMAVAAIVFGSGFGTAYPVFVAYVMQHVDARRRGASFGAILAAFDIGIGTGSVTIGWLIQRWGFPRAYGVAAALSALAMPYFLFMDRRARR